MNKSAEVKYRKDLQILVRKMVKTVEGSIVPLLRANESEYVADGYAQTLEQAFDNLRRSLTRIDTQAKMISSDFVTTMDRTNKERFYSAMRQAIGVDLGNTVQREDLSDLLIAKNRENVSLIKSIPEEYFKKVEQIVFSNTVTGATASSMIEQIRNVGKVTDSRAKLIARDQTSKLNSALSQARAKSAGIEEYVWRTAGDDRVRDSHSSKNGKVFRYDDPPKDTGHPGHDIQCRCVAQPIIKF